MKWFAFLADVMSAGNLIFWLLYLVKHLFGLPGEQSGMLKLDKLDEDSKSKRIYIVLAAIGYVVIYVGLSRITWTAPYASIVSITYTIATIWAIWKTDISITAAVTIVYHMLFSTMNIIMVITTGLYGENPSPYYSGDERDKYYAVFMLVCTLIWFFVNWGMNRILHHRVWKIRKVYITVLLFVGIVGYIFIANQFLNISLVATIGYVHLINRNLLAYYFREHFILTIYLLLFLVVAYGIYTIFTYKKMVQEQELAWERNRLLEDKYTQLNEHYMSNAKLYHDMNSHLQAIRHMAQHQNIGEITGYIDGMEEGMKQKAITKFTGLDVVDAILTENMKKAEDLGIQMTVDAHMIPVDIQLKNWELCSLFSNLLNNCLEAKATHVQVMVKAVKHMLLIQTKNDYQVEPEIVNGHCQSKKIGSHHGLGLKNVEDIVEKYEGSIGYSKDHGVFGVDIMLNIY